MAVARDLIHAARGRPHGRGGPRGDAGTSRAEHGADLPGDDVVVGPNEQGAAGHDAGTGPIVPGDGVIVDIWPRTAPRAAGRT